MKKIFTFISAIALAVVATTATVPTNLQNETLNYKVMYKWGVVHKQAGTAKLSIRNSGNQYLTQLTAKSDPWADAFFSVRDTLKGVINKAGFKPVRYDNIANEGGSWKHDVVIYDHSASPTVTAKCSHTKIKKKGEAAKTQNISLSANGIALDMLSMYYYMRYLDFPQMKAGQVTKLYVFSGRRKELLTIKYKGAETIEYDKKKWNTYHITFTFTSDGGKKTSDDMDAWISADQRRIPIKLEGKLAVGKVHCLYTGG